MSSQKSLKTRVETLRLKKGLTQAELAAMVFVTPDEINEIESGQLNQPMYILDLADALDVTPEYLQFGDGDDEALPAPLAEGEGAKNTGAEPSSTADYVAASVRDLWDTLPAADQKGLWWVLAKLDSGIDRRRKQNESTVLPGGVERRK